VPIPSPPIQPMLARLARELPVGDYIYEPKWDGFRAVAFAQCQSGREPQVEIQSRHGRPLGRYFPELTEALTSLAASRGGLVIDGEIVIAGPGGFEFAALLNRIHPAASRVDRLSAETPASFIAFDLLALDGADLMAAPFADRRRALEALLADARPPLLLTPATSDVTDANAWLRDFHGRGVDGVVAKGRALRYEPGRRTMVKVKHEETVDCVVAGMRLRRDPDSSGGFRVSVASLLLGLYDGDGGSLRHVGVASTFTLERRLELLDELAPLVVGAEGHPWEHDFNLGPSPMGRLPGSAGRWAAAEMERDWVPLCPSRVCEITYGQRDGERFRHPGRFLRWRDDREPRSCTLEQLAFLGPAPAALLQAS
jgi:ATP-dependent DNA ligase